eukprot:scaffold1786_cov138-Cylindrotheca_fusiformis.AAC.19
MAYHIRKNRKTENVGFEETYYVIYIYTCTVGVSSCERQFLSRFFALLLTCKHIHRQVVGILIAEYFFPVLSFCFSLLILLLIVNGRSRTMAPPLPSNSPHHPKPCCQASALCISIVAMVCCAFLFVSACTGMVYTRTYYGLWMETEATIVKPVYSGDKYCAQIQFETVLHNGNITTLLDTYCEDQSTDIPVGELITILYDPEDPQDVFEAKLYTTIGISLAIAMGVTVLCSCGFLICCIFLCRSSNNNATASQDNNSFHNDNSFHNNNTNNNDNTYNPYGNATPFNFQHQSTVPVAHEHGNFYNDHPRYSQPATSTTTPEEESFSAGQSVTAVPHNSNNNNGDDEYASNGASATTKQPTSTEDPPFVAATLLPSNSENNRNNEYPTTTLILPAVADDNYTAPRDSSPPARRRNNNNNEANHNSTTMGPSRNSYVSPSDLDDRAQPPLPVLSFK